MSSQIREAIGQDEVQAKRRRLAELRQQERLTVAEIAELELEVGNVPCAACGRSHAGFRCLESLG